MANEKLSYFSLFFPSNKSALKKFFAYDTRNAWIVNPSRVFKTLVNFENFETTWERRRLGDV